ncbi:Hypothetical protein GbCGDNIH8_8397 [Granulibacter bethesdensis]|nr:Hypothetical protein GbCGDNIH8_8397 [Granulibacter bethesdensis]
MPDSTMMHNLIHPDALQPGNCMLQQFAETGCLAITPDLRGGA